MSPPLGFNRIPHITFLIYQCGSNVVYILPYIDDIILIKSSHDLCKSIITLLALMVVMKDLGPLSCFMGIAVTKMHMDLFLVRVAMPMTLLLEPTWPFANLLLLQLTLSRNSVPPPIFHMTILPYIGVFPMLCNISHLPILTSLMLSNKRVFTCILHASSTCLH